MDIWLTEPFDITPTAILDIANHDGTLTTVLEQNKNKKFNNLLKAARMLSFITVTEGNKLRKYVEKGINSATFAAFIANFVSTRGIMETEEMPDTPFMDILRQLEKNSIERGLDKFPLSDISKIEQLEQFTMEEFEELFTPIWSLYPYRDEGYVRYQGFNTELFSFCQWSMEWSINSSAVSCEVTRLPHIVICNHH